jgi:hypothetical protein
VGMASECHLGVCLAFVSVLGDPGLEVWAKAKPELADVGCCKCCSKGKKP